MLVDTVSVFFSDFFYKWTSSQTTQFFFCFSNVISKGVLPDITFYSFTYWYKKDDFFVIFDLLSHRYTIRHCTHQYNCDEITGSMCLRCQWKRFKLAFFHSFSFPLFCQHFFVQMILWLDWFLISWMIGHNEAIERMKKTIAKNSTN